MREERVISSPVSTCRRGIAAVTLGEGESERQRSMKHLQPSGAGPCRPVLGSAAVPGRGSLRIREAHSKSKCIRPQCRSEQGERTFSSSSPTLQD